MAPAQIQRPGFGLPLEQMPEWNPDGKKDRFPHAIADFFASEGVSLRELRMLDFINQITDKPRWWEKIQDETIVSRWRIEACGDDEEQQRFSADHLDQPCFDYCMSELRDKADYLQRHGVVPVLDTMASVVKADVGADDSFWLAIREAAHPLEDVLETHKDWHPGSDGLVLDLLHPSLFPLRLGWTRVLPDSTVPLARCAEYIGRGEPCAVPDVLENQTEYHKTQSWSNEGRLRPWGNYQWLPSEVRFDANGHASIESYINNLHPKHNQELYRVLGQAVDRALPLWNQCLSGHYEVRIPAPDELGWQSYAAPSYPELTREQLRQVKSIDSDDVNSDDDGWSYEQQCHYENWLRNHPDERLLIQPTADQPYVPLNQRSNGGETVRLDLPTRFPDGLQVIFKLANIHLTATNPMYSGSNWHIEGALNEHICATALFYYDSENITDNYLQFRQHLDAEAMVGKAMQHEYAAAEDMYGVRNEESNTQHLGKVLTRPGRWLAFPNVMQHKVGAFSLQDQSRPGHRKILAMFLVDPHVPILSTANVPPQQRTWWAEEIRTIGPLAELPVELFEKIVDAVDDFPVAWDAACKMREALMAERGRITEGYQDMVDEDSYLYFCEH